MKNTLILITLLFTAEFVFAQSGKVCWRTDSYGYRYRISCDNFVPPSRPYFTIDWDIDSLQISMENKLISEINNHRISIGLSPLIYSSKLYHQFTLPHNQYQVKVRKASHNDYNGNGMKERCPKLNWCGYQKIGENVASHQRWETEGKSLLFEQYMRSEKHKELIENPEYVYYSTSVIYNYENNTFYNTLNVSR